MCYRKVILLCFFGWIHFNANASCRLQGENIVSLSAPVTHYLRELGLLNDPKLVAISSFHGLSSTEFKKEILAGGVFLSSKKLSKYKDAVIFFDESADLKKNLFQRSFTKIYEIKSRGRTPFQVHDLVEKILAPYLYSCDENKKVLNEKIASIKTKWIKFKNIKLPMFFFMGPIIGSKPAELVMRDGPVLYLEEIAAIDTYPSPFNYVSWSQKILKQWQRKGVVWVGLSEHGELGTKKIEADIRGFNITSPLVFIPGIPQIYLLDQLINEFAKYVPTKIHKTN